MFQHLTSTQTGVAVMLNNKFREMLAKNAATTVGGSWANHESDDEEGNHKHVRRGL